MLRITVDPKTLFLSTRWTLYAHLQSVSSTYFNSYIELGNIETVSDFWQYLNNIELRSLHSDCILYDCKRIIAFSLFRGCILPEWEDPINANGSEWGCRDQMDAGTFENMFNMLALSVVNEEMPNVIGVRCINKCNKSRNLFKIELWMCNSTDEELSYVKQEIDKIVPSHITFTLMHHEEKQQQAQDYCKTRRSRKDGRKKYW